MKNIAVFASGSGSNAEQIAKYFEGHPEMRIVAILTNNPKAGVIERAKNFNLPYKVFSKAGFYQGDEVLNYLIEKKTDCVVLAGFLWLMPHNLLKKFPCMVNIHPALLPKYGGKGMYGIHVHTAVYKNKETKSGITIHMVNENYDEGNTIFQKECDLDPNEQPEDIAKKVLKLEHYYYPRVIEDLIRNACKK
ncbi:MAG: phosphoribosylglycinamide formyltransferase [Cyclobacteriaceae bacterium]|nr:phosphoribosylglycinamide formyltransferase [Cyclobacteriaceae bacterium]